MAILVLIAQVYLGLYFLYSGIGGHFMQREMITGFGRMRGVPAAEITVPLTGLMLIGAGLSFLLGFWVTVGAWLAIIFLLLAAFLVHHFWTDTDPMMRGAQQIHFMKNLALAAPLVLATLVPKTAWVIRLNP